MLKASLKLVQKNRFNKTELMIYAKEIKEGFGVEKA